MGLFSRKKTESQVDNIVLESEKLFQQGEATVRGLIAPSAMRISAGHLQVGDVFVKTIFAVAYPRFLQSNWFSPIVNLDITMDVSYFIHPIKTTDIIKQLRRSATQIQSQIHIEEEAGKIRNSKLETALQDVESLRDKLLQGTEHFFRFGLYMTVYSDNIAKLATMEKEIQSLLEAQLVFVKPAVLRMEQGFASTLPLANDEINVGNNFNTGPLSTTFPFVSSTLSSNDGILYGINRHNNSLVLLDRFKQENANMVIFAKSGAGKSYAVKLEILRSMMMGTQVFVIDPENEYKNLNDTVGGTFVKLSIKSHSFINPFDLPKVGEDESKEEVLRSQVASLIGLIRIMIGSTTPEEDSILDKALTETYAIRDITPEANFDTLGPDSYPTMTDLSEVLHNMEGAESLAARLEKYTTGIFSGFLNHHTNVQTDNQMIVFNIRDLEAELRPVAMYIALQFIWNKMRAELKKRMIVVDEAWVMMQKEDAASFLFGIAKRCRKYYTGLTTITQDISDFMASRYGKPIVTNSSLQLLLRQSPASINTVADTFFLTDHEKFLLLESNVGEGILFAGTKHVAIKVVASYSEDQIITSDPRQLLEKKQEAERQELEAM